MRKRIWTRMLVALLALAFLTACGSGNGQTPSVPVGGSTEPQNQGSGESQMGGTVTDIETLPPEFQNSNMEVIVIPELADASGSVEFFEAVKQTGTLVTEPLEVTSWQDQRIAWTSRCSLGETEVGLYCKINSLVYYADKVNPSNWVPLCAKPDCAHWNERGYGCDAFSGGSILIQDGQIYYITSYNVYGGNSPDESLKPADFDSYCLVAMDLDGSDREMVFQFEELEKIFVSGGWGGNMALNPDHFFIYSSTLNPDGLYDLAAYVVDETGEYKAFSATAEEEIPLVRSGGSRNMYGDPCYYLGDVEGSTSKVYRIRDRELYGTDLADLPLWGSYLSGNNLRCYMPGYGYYDVDLTTREAVHLAPPQLEHGRAIILQPNCILETTLTEEREPGLVQEHSLRFFDGQSWLDVTLPEELAHAGDEVSLTVEGLTSDRILFSVWSSERDSGTYRINLRLYQLPLGGDTLEYLTTIVSERPED